MEGENLSPENRRSFNRFLIAVILIMIVTGFVALWDNWGGDIVEETGSSETKRLSLPNGVKVDLLPESNLRFQKGSAHKIVLIGSAEIETGLDGSTRQISFETSDLVARSRQAKFRLNTGIAGTGVQVDSGQVHLILKPESEGALFLEQGESFQHQVSREE